MPRAGWTALHYAAAAGYSGVIARLLARGADRAARDDAGRSPLEVALESGRAEAASLIQKQEDES